jgi:hypothetical protein
MSHRSFFLFCRRLRDQEHIRGDIDIGLRQRCVQRGMVCLLDPVSGIKWQQLDFGAGR